MLFDITFGDDRGGGFQELYFDSQDFVSDAGLDLGQGQGCLEVMLLQPVRSLQTRWKTFARDQTTTSSPQVSKLQVSSDLESMTVVSFLGYGVFVSPAYLQVSRRSSRIPARRSSYSFF